MDHFAASDNSTIHLADLSVKRIVSQEILDLLRLQPPLVQLIHQLIDCMKSDENTGDKTDGKKIKP